MGEGGADSWLWDYCFPFEMIQDHSRFVAVFNMSSPEHRKKQADKYMHFVK